MPKNVAETLVLARALGLAIVSPPHGPQGLDTEAVLAEVAVASEKNVDTAGGNALVGGHLVATPVWRAPGDAVASSQNPTMIEQCSPAKPSLVST